MKARFLFVGGCERSGTSLLQKLLCSHSAIVGGAELMFSGRIAELHYRMRWTLTAGPQAYSRRLGTFFTAAELDDAFRALYRRLLEGVGESGASPAYISEKTPSNIFAAAHLLRLFPDAKFVHLVRDGRGVLASHRGVWRRLRASDGGADRSAFRTRTVCSRWNAAVAAHRALTDDSDLAPRYFWMRLEDLLREPEIELRRLFDFLDLELEEVALRPEAIVRREGEAVIDGTWHTEEMERAGFVTEKIDHWKHDLPIALRWLSTRLMAVGLRELGYRPTLSEPARR